MNGDISSELSARLHRENLRLSQQWEPKEHVLKVAKFGSGSTDLTSFERDKGVIFGSDEFEKLTKRTPVFLPVFQESGLGQISYVNFGKEFFPDARRLDKFGDLSKFSIWENIKACRHKIFHHGQCSTGGENYAFAVNCGDLSCGSYQDSKARLYAEIACKDIRDLYSSCSINFEMRATTYELTCSLFVRKLLEEKMLTGAPVKSDLCQIGASIISEVFLDVVDNVRGVSRVEGIIHNVIHDFSSGKKLPYGKSKGRVFLERGLAYHLQGFILNLARRKDGSFFRLSNVGRYFSPDELAYYRLIVGQRWKSAIEEYLGVEIPVSELNSEGGLNVHFDYVDNWGSERGGLLHRLSYDNRSAIYSVMGLIHSGGLSSEMGRLRSEDMVGFERAKRFLSVVCSIPDESGFVFGANQKSSNWYGLFAAKRKPRLFKELGLVFKSRRARIDEIYRMRKHECPVHLGGEIVVEKIVNSEGLLVPVEFSYLGILEHFPDIQIVVAGGLSRVEVWRERDKGLLCNG